MAKYAFYFLYKPKSMFITKALRIWPCHVRPDHQGEVRDNHRNESQTGFPYKYFLVIYVISLLVLFCLIL